MEDAASLRRECAAEFLGTFILVFFGVGSVHVAVLTGGLVGLWQVAIVWGIAIALAIYATSAVSGTHINPAITLAFAVWRGFPPRKVPAYVLSQLLGAVAAAATLYALFHNLIGQFEAARGLVRGLPGSQLSAMVYGEYFPNPALLGTTAAAFAGVTHVQAMLGEGIGTAFLAFFVFAVTDVGNPNRPHGTLFAVAIGLTVSIVIAIVAPLTQAGLNPARDFGPRLFAWLAGWGSIAIPGPRGGFFTVYILSPCLGALAGAAVYQLVVAPGMAVAPAAVAAAQAGKESIEMQKPRLILVGGFLGAGKTTLLAQAAQRLVRQGKRVGLITNDQAADLVDTEILRGQGFGVSEISGGCFCCRFDNLVASANELIAELRPDVLIGEPVGSCTDLSATVLQPLKKLYAEKFRIAPFTVLADPGRLREALGEGADASLPESVLYVVRKQLEEADALVLNKADLLAPGELAELEAAAAARFPGTPVLVMSAATGDGVDAWLDFVLADRPAGRRIAEVDYDTYAEGEAVLGWLNASVQLRAEGGADWTSFSQALLEAIQRELAARPAEIAHVKLHLSTVRGSLVANLTSTGGRPATRGQIGGKCRNARLTLNARVHMAPADLRAVAQKCLEATAGDQVKLDILSLRNFSPARPTPTHRFRSVV